MLRKKIREAMSSTLPIVALALILSFFVPDIFTAAAFDSPIKPAQIRPIPPISPPGTASPWLPPWGKLSAEG